MSTVRHTTCNLCDAMCGVRVTVENNRVTDLRGDPEDPLSRGHICAKAPALVELLEDPDRLRGPMRRTVRGFEPVSWDEALDEAEARLGAVRATHGKDAIGIYVGNPAVHSHGLGLGSQLLSMALGTRNRFDANSQDGNPRLFACLQVYGDALAMPVPDVDRTDLLLILGGNPLTSAGSMMSLGDVRGRMRAIRERGGRVIVIDPRRTETAAWADAHHFIRPGGDAALCLALLHVLFGEGLVDERLVAPVADGLEALREISARYPPERVAPAIGIAADTVRAIARDLARTPRAVVYSRVGVSQNEFGPTASWLIEALNVVTGHFDVEGGAMFPSPAADLGPLARLVAGEAFDRFRSRVRGLPEFLGALPSSVMSEEMETEGEGRIRAFVCVAGNPVLSTPNGGRLARALAGLESFVAIDHYINETTRHAHLVLPPAHALEVNRFDLILLGLAVRNVVRYAPAVVEPPPDARDDFQILSELALRIAVKPTLLRRALRRVLRDLPDRTVDWLLRAGPHGDHFLPHKRGLSLARLRAAEHGIDLGPLVPSRRWRVHTDDGRVRLAPSRLVADLPRLDRWLDGTTRSDGSLALIGRRSVRTNNSWMHNVRSLVKGPDRSALYLHPEDAARRGLVDGAMVRLRGPGGEVRVRLSITDEVMRGVASLPHGYGHAAARETMRVAGAVQGANVNAITDEHAVEPLVGTTIFSGLRVEVLPD